MAKKGKKMGKILLRRIADMHFQRADANGDEELDEVEFLLTFNEMLLEDAKKEAAEAKKQAEAAK